MKPTNEQKDWKEYGYAVKQWLDARGAAYDDFPENGMHPLHLWKSECVFPSPGIEIPTRRYYVIRAWEARKKALSWNPKYRECGNCQHEGGHPYGNPCSECWRNQYYAGEEVDACDNWEPKNTKTT